MTGVQTCALPISSISILVKPNEILTPLLPQANDSVHITWESPSSPSGKILEYSMYLAVKKSRPSSGERPSQLAFIRIYRGTKTLCTVSPAHLANADIDCSAPNRPAVVFRIAAKNEQGYGPATQIRWLQGRGLCVCRSEEHTSELQSLTTISYAVFCLKKKSG